MEKTKVRVSSKGIVALEREIVWQKLINFGGTEKFVPKVIEKVTVHGSGIGAVRNIQLIGGGEIIEKLTSVNNDLFEMKFIIMSTPMQVFDYEGILKIDFVDSKSCEVSFESIYEVIPNNEKEIFKIIKDFQEVFISNLTI
ncbi:hypothetical protein SAMN02927916_1905 [Flavobacterium anhuiense]|uniref:Polyketide cyclase / dehydrase and lipid transport n=1 Tax=Flavobacterium anhuiense TaxID=459526 RepID=A0ABY0LMJ2_9FLAO|nr:hypothetical protein [Flavobacterium anhuiense]SCY39262.1 hypothetical protein SAMN02927916_1905 [Flavobacterium anhuiense]